MQVNQGRHADSVYGSFSSGGTSAISTPAAGKPDESSPLPSPDGSLQSVTTPKNSPRESEGSEAWQLARQCGSNVSPLSTTLKGQRLEKILANRAAGIVPTAPPRVKTEVTLKIPASAPPRLGYHVPGMLARLSGPVNMVHVKCTILQHISIRTNLPADYTLTRENADTSMIQKKETPQADPPGPLVPSGPANPTKARWEESVHNFQNKPSSTA
ncbi:MAG: hypothetical protein LBT98_02225 [Puniceicoccales bacterium]|nr:hypothetical protein [Puniceicoccales bacterium]